LQKNSFAQTGIKNKKMGIAKLAGGTSWLA
jgi:hypothetical protein